MTYPEVQFVAAPEPGATVLFDFNDNFGSAPSQIVSKSFTLGTPSIEGDPDGLGVQYGSRTAGFSLLIYGGRQAAMETQALLARTFMLRRRGWLRVRLDAFSAPVWLRTYTPTPAELDFSLISPDADVDAWQLEVEIPAEPFIRGERIALWSGDIKDNPAGSPNPTQVVLPAVVGDAPSPLRIEAAFSGARDRHDILLATSAVPAGYAPIVWQIGTGDGWTVGGDTSAPIADAQFSGGTYRNVTFAGTTGFSTRLAGTAPTVPPPGRYRVFLRSARDAAGTFAVRLGYRRAGVDIFDGSPTATLTYQIGKATMLDLGEFEFPLPSGVAGVTSTATAPSLALTASRTSGVGNLILDAFVLVPVDIASMTTLEPWEKSDSLVSSFAALGPQGLVGETQMWDGDSEISMRRLSGVSDAFLSPVMRGKFPTVRPGVSNLLTLFQQTAASSPVTPSSSALVTATATVVVTYQPRWLYLGDA